jgi:hypothetical protein
MWRGMVEAPLLTVQEQIAEVNPRLPLYRMLPSLENHELLTFMMTQSNKVDSKSLNVAF